MNKTNNAVQLKHVPTGITVRCQPTRSLARNRRAAQDLLALKVDAQLKGPVDSVLGKRHEKKRRRKRKAAARARAKYGSTQEQQEEKEQQKDASVHDSNNP